jgi:hypothetical protein
MKLVCIILAVALLTSCGVTSSKGEILAQLDGDHRSVIVDLAVVEGDWTRLLIACPGASRETVAEALSFPSEGAVDLRDSDDQVLFFVDHESIIEKIRFTPADHVAWCVSANPGISSPHSVTVADRVGLDIELVRVDAETNELLGNVDTWIASEPVGVDAVTG